MAEASRRRKWVKLWAHESLTGTLRRELQPDERSVWWDFLALSGDGPQPGRICFYPGVALTDEQICLTLQITADLLNRARQKLIATSRISVANGIITILNWDRYQSEYDRTRNAPSRSTPESTPESTPDSGVRKVQQPVQQLVQQLVQQTVHVEVEVEGEGRGEVEKDKEKDINTTSGEVIANWEKTTGRLITAFEGQLLEGLEDEYGPLWVTDAILEAAGNGRQKVNIKYIQRILDRWKEEGKGDAKTRRRVGNPSPGAPGYTYDLPPGQTSEWGGTKFRGGLPTAGGGGEAEDSGP